MRRAPFILFPLILLLAACGGSDSETPSEIGPEVVGVAPADGSTDIGLIEPILLEFSEPVEPATITPATVGLGTRTVDLVLELDEAGTTLQVLPDLAYPAEAELRLTLGEEITDLEGHALEPFEMSFETGVNDCAHLTDRFEPNDDTASATLLETDRLYPTLSSCALNRDWYRFALDDTLKVTARTHIDFSDGENWHINWRRADGDTYGTHGMGAETGEESSCWHSFLPGEYWVEIYMGDGGATVLYDLILETGEAPADDGYEDNDFDDEAAAIAEGFHDDLIGNYLDEDWFSLPMTEGQTLTVTLDTGDYDYHRYFHVRDPGGTNSQGGTSQENPRIYVMEATATGEALIAVQTWRDDIPYSLDIALDD